MGQQLLGINENKNDFKFSRWCYDTPGVVQPDQVNPFRIQQVSKKDGSISTDFVVNI